MRRLLLKAGSLRRLGGSSGRLAGVPEAREDYFALKSCYYLALFGQLVRGRRIREDGGGKSSLYSVYFSDYRGVVATENVQKPLENEGFSEYGGAVATGNVQKPMEKHDFSQGGVTQPPPPPTR